MVREKRGIRGREENKKGNLDIYGCVLRMNLYF